MNNRRDFSRLFVFRYNKRVAFLKNALFVLFHAIC